MAAFGEDECMTSSLYDTIQGSQPLKRVEPSIQKFTKIVIPTDLERLRQHKVNIEKFYRHRNWEKLTTEQVNARQTVQQLKANIREMEKTRSLIIEEDLPSFDSRVCPVKEEAILAVVQFIEMNNTDQLPLGVAHPIDSAPERESALRQRYVESWSNDEFEVIDAHDSPVSDTISDDIDNTKEETELKLLMLKQADVQSKASMESWENLQNDLMSLNSLIHEFATHVRVQGETVDNIADNIDTAEKHVSSGYRHLIKASSLKAALLPVSGAIIGGCLGGPVGIYAGIKIGTVAALGGGAIGYVSGRFLKKRKEKQVSMELQEIEDVQERNRRTSDPGLIREAKKTR